MNFLPLPYLPEFTIHSSHVNTLTDLIKILFEEENDSFTSSELYCQFLFVID